MGNRNIYPTTRSWIAVFDLGQILHCWNWLLMSNAAQKLKLQQPTFPGWHTAIPAKRLPRLCCLAHGKSGVWPLKTECQVSSIVEAQRESEQDTDKITGINKKSLRKTDVYTQAWEALLPLANFIARRVSFPSRTLEAIKSQIVNSWLLSFFQLDALHLLFENPPILAIFDWRFTHLVLLTIRACSDDVALQL